jgi:hypothetical protein
LYKPLQVQREVIMEISIKLEGVEKAMRMFDPNNVRKAANAALNRVAGSGKTEASKLIRQDYNIKAARINQFLRLAVRARGNDMEAVISGRGLGIALAYFDARQQGFKMLGESAGRMRTTALLRTGRKRGDVTVRVKRSGGRKVVGPKYSNRPFLAQMKSGHIGAFVRTGRARKPIEQLLGPGVGGLFGSAKIMQAVKKRINELWSKEFKHQLDYQLGRIR